MIAYINTQQPVFPNPLLLLHQHNGLIAISSELTTEMLHNAYLQGIFPWYCDQQYFYWFATNPRFILLPEQLNISRSLAKSLRNKTYRITVNQAFSQVITNCAQTARPNQNGTWIAPEFQAAYTALHQQGYAHSFECWLPENDTWQLMGGLYGVQIGRVFYGESMFTHVPDASKIAFVHAVSYLQNCGIELIDCQQETKHLARFGAICVPFQDFQAALNRLNPQVLKQEIAAQIIMENKI